jgi:acyl-CoA hydrolase
VPSSSVGNNKTWLDRARQVVLEVNAWQSAALEGMHDTYYDVASPPNRRPISLVRPEDCIGEIGFCCGASDHVFILCAMLGIASARGCATCRTASWPASSRPGITPICSR